MPENKATLANVRAARKSMPSRVLVVLTHYKRPQNLAAQIKAFQAQDIPVDIVLVDNAETSRISTVAFGGGHRVVIDGKISFAIADVYSFRTNAGPSCRFIAPFMDIGHDFCLLYDDDMIPEPGAVRHLLDVADQIGDTFSELGVVGRNFTDSADGWRYNRKAVQRLSSARKVHMLCRAHLFPTHLAHKILELRQSLFHCGVDPADIRTHDDLLCVGLTGGSDRRPMLIPEEPAGCKLIGCELDDNDAVHRTPGFYRSRNELIAALVDLRLY